jgi:hypothetical protein
MLQKFPDDIWKTLSPFIDGFSIINLCNTGCISLCMVLSRSASHFTVTEMPYWRPKLPRILSSFSKLKIIDISASNLQLGLLFMRGINLETFPSCLIELKLGMANGLLSAFRYDPIKMSAYSLQLPTMFPSLQVLHLGSGHGYSEEEEMNFLPFLKSLSGFSSLRSLQLGPILKLSLKDVSYIPQTLDSLDIHLDVETNDEWQNLEDDFHLPPNLTKLHISGVSIETLIYLPRELLDLSLIWLSECDVSENEDYSNLPNGLTSLELLAPYHTFTNNLAQSLPSSLLNLKLDVGMIEPSVGDFLPPSLLSMSVKVEGGSSESDHPTPSLLPRSLTQLPDFMTGFTSSDWGDLPRTLQVLSYGFDERMGVLETEDPFPPFEVHKVDFEHIPLLPPTLKRIRITANDPSSLPPLPLGVTHVEFARVEKGHLQLISHLKHLRHLTLGEDSLLNLSDLKIPLQSLKVFGECDVDQLKMNEIWAENLTKLSFDRAPRRFNIDEWFQTFPPSLTHLRLGSLNRSNSVRYPNSVLTRLPSLLVDLIIPLRGGLSRTDLLQLPSSLTSLRVVAEESNLTLNDLQDTFPPLICFANLPASLSLSSKELRIFVNSRRVPLSIQSGRERAEPSDEALGSIIPMLETVNRADDEPPPSKKTKFK